MALTAAAIRAFEGESMRVVKAGESSSFPAKSCCPASVLKSALE